MTLEEFAELYEVAARLERAGLYADARDAFLVAGDAAEEIGNNMDYAREARRRSMLNHVAWWARGRWPAEELYIHNVMFSDFPFGTFGRRRSRVDLRIRRRHRGSEAVTDVHVTVGRRGDVRLEHDAEGRARGNRSRGRRGA